VDGDDRSAAIRWTWILFGAETITMDGSSIVSEFHPAIFRKRRLTIPTGLVDLAPLANRKFGCSSWPTRRSPRRTAGAFAWTSAIWASGWA